ncbi:MAG: hypothetical protein RLT87_08145 [Gammaproteobacteria bacterium]
MAKPTDKKKPIQKQSDTDWSVLRTPLILLFACVLVSGSMIAGSYYFNTAMEKEYKLQKTQFQTISRRYLDIDQEEKLLLDYYPRFVKLYNDGIIGRERRLDWIEALRQSGEKVDIPKLSYAIESQSEYLPAYSINYNGFKLYSSRMELKLGLLHEGDMFNLLNALNNNAKGLYTVSQCSFKKRENQIRFERDHVNIDTACTLQWITINLPDGKDIEIL